MISISQDKNIFFYIHWIPSESGPLILNFGKETVKTDSENNQIFYDVLDRIRIRTNNESFIYLMTIDSNRVSLSETLVDKSFDHFDVLDWFNQKIIGETQYGLNETFHYSFSKNQNKYLNIHFRSDIKKKMSLFAEDNNSEIRNIGLGIFSAEVTARCVMNADYNESYAILQVGKECEALIINGKELTSYVKFSLKNKKSEIIKNYGDVHNSKKLVKEIELLKNKKNLKIKTVDHLYFYKKQGKYSIINKLIDNDKSNISPINIFSHIKNNNQKSISIQDGLLYAETGCTFWGIDV